MELNDYLKLPYTITLRADDDGGWVARIQELPGCTADGDTQAEALAELEQAKREWIQAALEDEVPIPQPESDERLPSGKWVQRVARSLHKNLVRLARMEGISLNQLVATVLARYVGGSEQKTQGTATSLVVFTGPAVNVFSLQNIALHGPRMMGVSVSGAFTSLPGSSAYNAEASTAVTQGEQ